MTKKWKILSNGKIVAQDTPSNLVQDINAKNAYFGDNFWSQLKYGIGSSSTLQTNEDLLTFQSAEIKSPLTDLSLTIGYALYLNSAISINPNFSYEIKTKENKDKVKRICKVIKNIEELLTFKESKVQEYINSCSTTY